MTQTDTIAPEPHKIALSLLGGGITGAFFHFGVLAALDDHLSRKTTSFDLFTGVSAGSFAATVCALGLSPQMVLEDIISEKGDLFSIKRRDIYRYSLRHWSKETFKLLWTLFYISYMKIEDPAEAPSYFWGLKDALPSGMFSMKYYEGWIRKTFEKNGAPLFFSQLDKEL